VVVLVAVRVFLPMQQRRDEQSPAEGDEAQDGEFSAVSAVSQHRRGGTVRYARPSWVD
jgi:hypothetical protein